VHILGVPTDAAASEVRRACARRVRRIHPDFSHVPAAPGARFPVDEAELADVAIDFVEMRAFLDQIQAAFFGADRRSPDAEDGASARSGNSGHPDKDA
jgi:curved DNA-binding protein CbpA